MIIALPRLYRYLFLSVLGFIHLWFHYHFSIGIECYLFEVSEEERKTPDKEKGLSVEKDFAEELQKSAENLAGTASMFVTMLRIVAAYNTTDTDLAETCSSFSSFLPELLYTIQHFRENINTAKAQLKLFNHLDQFFLLKERY